MCPAHVHSIIHASTAMAASRICLQPCNSMRAAIPDARPANKPHNVIWFGRFSQLQCIEGHEQRVLDNEEVVAHAAYLMKRLVKTTLQFVG